MDDLPPPTYTETPASSSAISSSMSYIASRPAPSNPPSSNKNVHKLSRASLSYPAAFAQHDVTLQDWQTFLQNLALPEDKPSKAAERQLNFVLAEWNDEFFAPRGVKVELAAEPGDARGVGFKLGNTFVGASWSDAGGYGLKIGDTVLGVRMPTTGEPFKSETTGRVENANEENDKIDDKREGDKVKLGN